RPERELIRQILERMLRPVDDPGAPRDELSAHRRLRDLVVHHPERGDGGEARPPSLREGNGPLAGLPIGGLRERGRSRRRVLHDDAGRPVKVGVDVDVALLQVPLHHLVVRARVSPSHDHGPLRADEPAISLEPVGALRAGEAANPPSFVSASAIALTAPLSLAWTRFASSKSRWAVERGLSSRSRDTLRSPRETSSEGPFSPRCRASSRAISASGYWSNTAAASALSSSTRRLSSSTAARCWSS